jgi:hypothetical protein
VGGYAAAGTADGVADVDDVVVVAAVVVVVSYFRATSFCGQLLELLHYPRELEQDDGKLVQGETVDGERERGSMRQI